MVLSGYIRVTGFGVPPQVIRRSSRRRVCFQMRRSGQRLLGDLLDPVDDEDRTTAGVADPDPVAGPELVQSGEDVVAGRPVDVGNDDGGPGGAGAWAEVVPAGVTEVRSLHGAVGLETDAVQVLVDADRRGSRCASGRPTLRGGGRRSPVADAAGERGAAGVVGA